MKHLTNSAFVILLIIAVGCSQPEQAGQSGEELVKTVNVETRELKPQPFERHLKLVGTVEAQNDVQISAEVAGRIEQYFVEKGDQVQKGDPVAKIDDSQLLREKERLEAITTQAKENYERLKRLYEQEGIGSEIDFLNAKYDYEQNNAALEAVKVSIGKTTVNAPFNASVEDILVEEGEMVSPGVVMTRLIGTDKLKISAGVPGRFSDVVTLGDRAQVWFDFASSDTLRLPITFVGSSIDQQARTFEVEIDLPKKTRSYKVDMIANVKLRTFKAEEVIVIGEEYLFQKEKGYVVYRVGQNEDGETVAKEVPVTLGSSYENKVIVEKGLQPGDRLITVGASFVQNDMRINIVNNQSQELAQQRN